MLLFVLFRLGGYKVAGANICDLLFQISATDANVSLAASDANVSLAASDAHVSLTASNANASLAATSIPTEIGCR